MIDTPLLEPAPLARGGSGRFRSHGGAVAGLVGLGLILLVGVAAPLLANRRPIICQYQGRLHFPALAETVRRLPFGEHLVRQSKPFDFPTFDSKRDLPADGFAIWPPLRFGPRETSADILQAPSRDHLLGTDQVGRDVAARLLHAASVSVGVGLLATALAALIGIPLGGLAGVPRRQDGHNRVASG